VYVGNNPMPRRNILPPSSGSRVSEARDQQKQNANSLLLLIPCLAYLLSLKMEVTCSSEKSGCLRTTQPKRLYSSTAFGGRNVTFINVGCPICVTTSHINHSDRSGWCIGNSLDLYSRGARFKSFPLNYHCLH
jgi:hypothetical protein